MNEYELYHHGVKGQRWGIRRYQNKDGTLTKAGQKRYDKEMEKLKKEERVLKNKQRTAAKLEKLESKRKEVESLRSTSQKKEAEKPSTSAKKSIKDMSDDELRSKVARLELEKRYKDLNPKQVSSGKKFINDVLKPSMTNTGRQLINEYTLKLGKKYLGLDTKKKYETPDSLKELEDKVKALNLEKRLKELEKDK